MTARLLPGLTALVLVAMIVFLGSALTNRLSREIDISPITARVAAPGTGPVSGALPQWQGQDPERLTAIVEAPLFIEGRRMPDDLREPAQEIIDVKPEPEAPPPSPLAEPDADLVGVLISPDASKALVARRSSGQESWIGEADRLGDWTVETIAEDHIILRHDNEERRLDMRR